jgi:hypothetical protein
MSSMMPPIHAHQNAHGKSGMATKNSPLQMRKSAE